MAEQHQITGRAQGEPLPKDRIGACVRVPLDSAPSPRWSRAFGAHLATALTGHPAVGYLKLNNLVQGSVVVLEGVEPAEAEVLGPAIRDAIAAANRACVGDADPGPRNMPQCEADRVARTVDVGE